jgi:serpin B
MMMKIFSISDENFFISPFSVSTALAMSLIGAQNQTAEQIKQLLDLKSNKSQILEMFDDYLKTLSMLNKSDLILNVANKIYAKDGFKINQDFVNNLVKNFRSEIELIDFSKPSESAMTINNWVSNHTNNKIKNIIDPASLNSLTKIVLINTIYFNGKS